MKAADKDSVSNKGLQSKVILVTGGARSGKSQFAERLVADIARSRSESNTVDESGHTVAYIATSQIYDDEMARRVIAHRNQRPSSWRTVEEPYQLEKVIDQLIEQQISIVLIDCITLWISNLLLETGASGKEQWHIPEHSEYILERATNVGRLLEEAPFQTVIVTNEVGDSLVPEYPLGRVFRDLAGRVNQALAAASDDVFWVVCGVPVRLSELDWRRSSQIGGCSI